jgi:hypothetical protein
MHKGKQCKLNAPPGRKIKMEPKKPSKGYSPKKKSS